MQTTKSFGKRGRAETSPAPRRLPDVAVRPAMSNFSKTAIVWVGIFVTFLVFMLGFTAWLSTRTVELSPEAAVAEESRPLSGAEKTRLQVMAANLICDNLNAVSAGTAPCEVGGLSITIFSNSTVEHAQSLCTDAVAAVRQTDVRFDGKWTLYVKGPYSGDQSLAYCKLP